MAAELAAFKASQRAEDIPALCAAINGVGAPAEREELFKQLVDVCVREHDGCIVGPACVEASKAVVEGILSETVQIVVSRNVLAHFAEAIDRGMVEVIPPEIAEDRSTCAFSRISELEGVTDRGRSEQAKEARGGRLVEITEHALTNWRMTALRRRSLPA